MVLFIKRCTLYSFAPIRKLRLSSVALLRIVFFPICVAKNYFKSSAIHSFKMLGISSSGTPFHTLPSAHHAAAPWSCPLQTLPKENGGRVSATSPGMPRTTSTGCLRCGVFQPALWFFLPWFLLFPCDHLRMFCSV